MSKILKKYAYQKTLFFVFGFWILYAFFYGYFKAHSLSFISGYMSFFGETLLDLFIIILSWVAFNKATGKIKIFFILFFSSFCFSFFSDVIYNFYVNIEKYKITVLRDSFFDIPFAFFLLIQAVAWSYLFIKNHKFSLSEVSQYVPYCMTAFIIFFTFIFGMNWKMHYSSLVGAYQIIDTVLESIGFLFVSFCLIGGNKFWIKLLGIGYLIVVASDFVIRYLVVENLNFSFNPIETTWILGLLLIGSALTFQVLSDNDEIIINFNSLKARVSISLFIFSAITIFLFLLTSLFLSIFEKNMWDIQFHNISSILIVFFIASILFGDVISSHFLKPVLEIKKIVEAFNSGIFNSEDRMIQTSIHELKAIEILILNSLREKSEKFELQKKLSMQADHEFKITTQVAHDIRSPAAALLAITQSCVDIPETDRIALREVATRIQDIANNLLNQHQYPEENIGLVHQYSQSILISPVILQLLSEKRLQYRDSNIKFSYKFTKEGSFAFIKIDAVAFKRMLSNLINNAVDAADKDENHIIVYLMEDAEWITLIVEDNGKGMPKTVVEKIMNNVPVTDGKLQGHGIGLTQVRETLQYSNANFCVESQVGKGTKVIVHFQKSLNSYWIANKITLFPDSIVIILDDDPSIHQAWDIKLKSVLSAAHSISVHHFTDVQLAIDYINAFDQKSKNRLLLLTDYELIKQNLTGLDVILKTETKSAILVTSHYADKEIAERAVMMDVKILPKLLISEVPVFLQESRKKNNVLAKKKVDLVIVDDKEALVKIIVKHFLKEKKVDFYQNSYDFLKHLDEYPFDTKICLDYDFEMNGIDGLQLAEQLYQRGYQCLYIASGKSFSASELPDYLQSVEKHHIADIFRAD